MLTSLLKSETALADTNNSIKQFDFSIKIYIISNK